MDEILIEENIVYPLDLSGPNSHELIYRVGWPTQIGPQRKGQKASLIVDVDTPIHWQAFDCFYTDTYDRLFPKRLAYEGNDTNFINWSEQRPIHEITWTPCFEQNHTLDASNANIGNWIIDVNRMKGRLELILPKKGLAYIKIIGDLAKITMHSQVPVTMRFVPPTTKRYKDAPYDLPPFGLEDKVQDFAIYNDALAQAVSIANIGRFSALKALTLCGNITGFSALHQQLAIESLYMRDVAFFDDMPSLLDFPNLVHFVANSIDDIVGKKFKTELKKIKANREMKFGEAIKLRKAEWWAENIGKPFNDWRGKTAKQAKEAYATAVDEINAAKVLSDVEQAVIKFTRFFNDKKNIETSEREEIGDAVWKLSQLDKIIELGLDEDILSDWFDQNRDY